MNPTTQADNDYAMERDQRDYGFKDVNTGRVDASQWEREAAIENKDEFGDMTTNRKNFITGAPSGFGQKPQGYLRVSGNKGAHQLGKRK